METPPETFAVARTPRDPDTPGWLVRVVPNKYPAIAEPAGRTEVVVHSPRHVVSLADLDREELRAVAIAWRERAHAARAAGFRYVHALVNEGRQAGGSLSHAHSQLVWLRETPPAVAAENAAALAWILAEELAETRRVVAERDGVVAVCPAGGRGPYELLIAPAEPEPDAFASERFVTGLELLADAIRRLHTLEGRVPLNAWLHTGGHWHLEVLPRLTVAAGIELGAGIYVNPLPPEEAAAALRSAEAPPAR